LVERYEEEYSKEPFDGEKSEKLRKFEKDKVNEVIMALKSAVKAEGGDVELIDSFGKRFTWEMLLDAFIQYRINNELSEWE
jgi:hypothetical protein